VLSGRAACAQDAECYRKDIDPSDEQHDPVNYLEDPIVARDNPAQWGDGEEVICLL
jgi:hypothetical protein